MLGEPVLRRGARIPTSDTVVRFLVIPPSATDLVRLKLDRSPLLRGRLEQDNWHILKADHLRRLVARDDAGLERPRAAAGPRPAHRTTRRAAAAVRLTGGPDRRSDRSTTDDRRTTGRAPSMTLADRFWEGFLERNPIWATVLRRRALRRPPGRPVDRPAAREELAALEELDGSPAARAPRPADRGRASRWTSCASIAHGCAGEQHAHELWQIDGIDQMAGPQTLPTELARFQRLDTPERLDAAHRAARCVSGAT